METANTPAVLLLDLPPNALAGIDLLSFTATKKFKGIKNLTPGLHFVFSGSSTAFSERHGIWINIEESDSNSNDATPPLIVTKWNPETEALKLETDQSKLLGHRANLGAIWREGLTPYRQLSTKPSTDKNNPTPNQIQPLAPSDPEPEFETADETTPAWSTLTSHITPALLARITCNPHWALATTTTSPLDLEDIPGLPADLAAPADTAHLALLPIDTKRTWPAHATGRERTDAAQDRSWALEHVLTTHLSTSASSSAGESAEASHAPPATTTPAASEAFVGELQFTFLMVLTLNNFSCLEGWRRVLTLLLTCKRAVGARPGLWVAALRALRAQVRRCGDAEGGGLINFGDESGGVLRGLLGRFRRGVEGLEGGAGVNGGWGLQDVVEELEELEELLRGEFGWEFGGDFAREGALELEDGEVVRMDTTAFDEEDETGEFAPAMVDLTPEQARMLGVDLGGEESGTAQTMPLRGPKETNGGVSKEVESSSDESESEAGDLDEMDGRF